jgi:hypothetical protein
MALTRAAWLSAPGSDRVPNEDVARLHGPAAWVLDGATGLAAERLLAEEGTDAVWLALRYDALLAREAEAGAAPIGPMLRRLAGEVALAFRKARRRPPRRRYELPSAGMALARLRPGGLQVARLGDCRAILEMPDGRVLSTLESALGALDAAAVAAMQAFRKGHPGCGFAAARASVQERLMENRDRLNRRDGYQVLSLHPRAAAGAEVMDLPLAPGEQARGLLVSDGYYRLVDTVKICADDAELLRRSFAEGPAALLRELRAAEAADKECERFPRLKPRDDATALLFTAAVA